MSTKLAQYVIGIGSNLGSRVALIDGAMASLAELVKLDARSPIYRSTAMTIGGEAGPDFANAAVRIRTTLPPEALLEQLQAIEVQLGRVRGERWASRTIDLDILWSPRSTTSERVKVPHPGLWTRDFALRPLVDVATPEMLAQEPRFGARPELQLAKLPEVRERRSAIEVRAWNGADALAAALNRLSRPGAGEAEPFDLDLDALPRWLGSRSFRRIVFFALGVAARGVLVGASAGRTQLRTIEVGERSAVVGL